jgi:hypothetical protein
MAFEAGGDSKNFEVSAQAGIYRTRFASTGAFPPLPPSRVWRTILRRETAFGHEEGTN